MSAQDSALRNEPKPIAAQAAVVEDIGEAQRLSARRRERLMSIGSPLGLLLAWELAARVGWIDIRFFSAPSSIIAVMTRMAMSGELLEHVMISMQRITLGFLLGGVPPVILGVVMGI